MVLGLELRLIAIGVVLGRLVNIGATRLIASQLWGSFSLRSNDAIRRRRGSGTGWVGRELLSGPPRDEGRSGDRAPLRMS